MAILYHDVLDTVRTSEERKSNDKWGTGVAHLHARGLMVLYLLLGHQQRISQSQGFDSAIVLSCCSDEDGEEATAFLELIRRGYFQVPLFNQPSLLHAFRSKLETIELSSWPQAQDPDIRKLLVKHVDRESEGKDLPPEIKENLEAVRRLDSALRTSHHQSVAVQAPRDFSLSNWIARNYAIFNEREEESPTTVGLKMLNELQTDDRSKHYGKIREMDISVEDKEELKSIVNLGYNRVVSRSLQASQFALTTAQPKAAQTLDHLGEPFDAMELVTAETFPAIEKSSWSKVLRFLDETKHLPPHSKLREAFAANFIARVTADRSGWAIIPKLPGVAVELLQHKGIEVLIQLLTHIIAPDLSIEADIGIPPYVLNELTKAVEIKLGLGEKVTESSKERMIEHYERKYRGVLASLKMVQHPAGARG